MWRAFIVNCLKYRRKSLISRGGLIGITLLRRTLIICNITVPIYFHISPIIQFSRCEPQNSRRHSPYPKRSICPVLHKLDKRAESTRRTTMQKSCICISTMLCRSSSGGFHTLLDVV